MVLRHLGKYLIKTGIFQGDALLPLLFVTDLISLTYIKRTSNSGYEFRTGETINDLLIYFVMEKICG